MNSTRRQHHVWRSYLEAWAKDEKIFCLQGKRVFETNIKDAAVQKDFYKLHELTDADIYGIRLLIENSPVSSRNIMENFLVMFGVHGRLKAELALSTGISSDLKNYFDYEIINAEERFHASIESGIADILSAIKKRDISFYKDLQKCGRFLHFISLQNLRTVGVKKRIIEQAAEQQGFSLERCWNIVSHIMAANVGGSLFLERKERSLILLENYTNIPFITGDQPVINLMHASTLGEAPTYLAFYYPVSPTLAIILDEVDERTGYRAGAISTEQVQKLNREIQAAAYRQVFSNSRSILQSLI